MINSYENRVVAFVDILGFTETLKKTRTLDESGKEKDNKDFIEVLVSSFQRIAELMGVEEGSDDVAPSRQVTQFSDSIVISFKLEEAGIELRYLLEELLFLHIELLRNNILIRGGIYYGPLIHTNRMLFGPAMVSAYYVESKAANSPRIILPKSLHDIEKDFSSMSLKSSSNKLDDLLSRDEDDFYYLDYFDKCQNPELRIFVDDSEYIEHMRSMKKLIVSQLSTRDPGIYSKYGWMKTKWNSTLLKYQEDTWKNNLINERRTELMEYISNEVLIKDSM